MKHFYQILALMLVIAGLSYTLGNLHGIERQKERTPVVIKVQEKVVVRPVTIKDLDSMSAFDIFDYLKARNQRDQKRWKEAEGRIL